MTTTAELTALDVDLAREVPCTAAEGCDRTASWLGIIRHPDRTVCKSRTLCNDHRRKYLTWVARLPAHFIPECREHWMFLTDEWIEL